MDLPDRMFLSGISLEERLPRIPADRRLKVTKPQARIARFCGGFESRRFHRRTGRESANR